jgi:hypothetical protein
MKPQWSKVLYSDASVVSCPPCAVAALVNAVANLFTSLPRPHSGPAVSMNCLSWAAADR